MEYVPGDGCPNKDDKDTTNSKLHGPSDNDKTDIDNNINNYDNNDDILSHHMTQFSGANEFKPTSRATCDAGDTTIDSTHGPYSEPFRGCIWNCRSLWSDKNRRTFQQALQLAECHDFLILSETRETSTRKRHTESSLPKGYVMFSTGISARKGGVAIIAKRAFLDQFKDVVWTTIIDGRLARLSLDGPKGSLCLYAVYLDPSSADNQISAIR